MVIVKRGRHQGLSFGTGTPAAGAGDFGDQAVSVEALQETGDSTALAAGRDVLVQREMDFLWSGISC